MIRGSLKKSGGYMNIYQANANGYLDITFGPIWDYIPLTRNYIESFLMVHLIDKVDICKITIAVSELLENAVKHSISDGIRVNIIKHSENDQVELIVYNFANKKDYVVLKNIIDKANEATDTLQYYANEMKESYARHDGKARLGIPRIRHESGVRFELSFEEGKELNGIMLIKTKFDVA